MRYLIPVRIDTKHIPKNTERLLLGTWALESSDIENKNDINIVDYHYDNFDVLEDDFDYSKELYNKLIVILGDILNKYHSLDWDGRAWKIFLGGWLLEFIQIVLDRYKSVDFVLKNYKFDNIILTKVAVDIYDKASFQQYVSNDKYNHLLYSQVFKFIDENIYNKSIFIEYSQEHEDIVHGSLLNKIVKSNIVQTLLNKLTINSTCVMDYSYFSTKVFFKLFIKGFPNITPLINIPKCNYTNDKDNIIRNNLKKIITDKYNTNNKFEEFIISIIFNHMPLYAIENFNDTVSLSKNINLVDKNIFSTNNILTNEVLQCAVANQIKVMKNLIMSQHGGSYGIVKWSTPEFYEKDIADKYITFGWKDLESENTIPLSHPKLFLSNTSDIIKNKILYISNNTPRYFYKNWSNPISGESTKDYIINIKIFFANLNKNVITNSYLRLYPNDYGYGIEQYIGKNIKISKGDFYEELNSSELIICDNNQTTMLESLVLNKPTIIVWNINYWKINDDAKYIFKKLKEVGIFYDNPNEASEFVNNLVNNDSINNWWYNKEIQNVIEEFTIKYAYKNYNWLDDYMNLFIKV